MQTIAMAHWLAGRRTEAWYWLARLEDYAKRHELKRLAVSALFLRLRWLVQTDDEVGVEDVLQRIEHMAQEIRAQGSQQAQEIAIIARHSAAEYCLHRGAFAQARDMLTVLIEASQNHRNRRRQVDLHVQIAVAEQGLGRTEQAQLHLVEAVRLGHRLGLLRGILDASPAAVAMIEALLARNVLDAVLSFYVRRLVMAASALRVAGGQAVGQEETVKWHMKNIFLKLGVTGRDEAIAKARDLELKLPGSKAF
ncbi:transcriptional regulator MalT [compost metagenome]